MPEQSRGTVVVWVVAAVVAALVLPRLLDSQGNEPAAAPVKLDRPSASAGAAPGTGSSVYVHVAGAVRRQGLFRVAAGSRVATAIERAGGPTRKAELAAVNLAARVQDGQQIVVPGAPGAGPLPPGAAAGSAGAAGAAAAAKPSVASATIEQLDAIDGIGPTLAERIIEYRQEHGGFRSLAQLGEVEGIGEKRLETLREALQP